MKVLIACEYSGIVRDAFKAKGHDAWSCDILSTEIPGNHYQGDVLDILNDGWDLMIAHPPCTHLCVSGARWFKDKQKEQIEALEFVRLLMNAPIKRICIENPVSIISTQIRPPNQVIQPWMFGHYEMKMTCLWLKNLLRLKVRYKTYNDCRKALGIANGIKPEERIHKMAPGPDRGKERAKTYQGIADAMADQWNEKIYGLGLY